MLNLVKGENDNREAQTNTEHLLFADTEDYLLNFLIPYELMLHTKMIGCNKDDGSVLHHPISKHIYIEKIKNK